MWSFLAVQEKTFEKGEPGQNRVATLTPQVIEDIGDVLQAITQERTLNRTVEGKMVVPRPQNFENMLEVARCAPRGRRENR